MSIVNRSLDASEQLEEVIVNMGAIATGSTKFVLPFSRPCVLVNVRSSAAGVSNAMQLGFERITGAGSSGLPIGISNMVLQNRSVSGIVSFSGLAASGSTLLSFSAGDMIQVTSSVANGNVTDLVLSLVVRNTQDIVSRW